METEVNDTDDTQMGRWVYCDQHRRVHATGWCTVHNRYKTALAGKTQGEAHAEAISKLLGGL